MGLSHTTPAQKPKRNDSSKSVLYRSDLKLQTTEKSNLVGSNSPNKNPQNMTETKKNEENMADQRNQTSKFQNIEQINEKKTLDINELKINTNNPSNEQRKLKQITQRKVEQPQGSFFAKELKQHQNEVHNNAGLCDSPEPSSNRRHLKFTLKSLIDSSDPSKKQQNHRQTAQPNRQNQYREIKVSPPQEEEKQISEYDWHIPKDYSQKISHFKANPSSSVVLLNKFAEDDQNKDESQDEMMNKAKSRRQLMKDIIAGRRQSMDEGFCDFSNCHLKIKAPQICSQQ